MMKRLSSTGTAFFSPEQNSMMRLQLANFKQYSITLYKFEANIFSNIEALAKPLTSQMQPIKFASQQCLIPHQAPSQSAFYLLTNRRMIAHLIQNESTHPKPCISEHPYHSNKPPGRHPHPTKANNRCVAQGAVRQPIDTTGQLPDNTTECKAGL